MPEADKQEKDGVSVEAEKHEKDAVAVEAGKHEKDAAAVEAEKVVVQKHDEGKDENKEEMPSTDVGIVKENQAKQTSQGQTEDGPSKDDAVEKDVQMADHAAEKDSKMADHTAEQDVQMADHAAEKKDEMHSSAVDVVEKNQAEKWVKAKRQEMVLLKRLRLRKMTKCQTVLQRRKIKLLMLML